MRRALILIERAVACPPVCDASTPIYSRFADGPNTASDRFQRRARQTSIEKGMNMLWTAAVVLMVLWALGLATSHTLGGFLHVLLILAVVAVVVRLVQGRKAIP
jgi:hypothetical protein